MKNTRLVRARSCAGQLAAQLCSQRCRAPRGAQLCHGSRCGMLSSCLLSSPAPRWRRGGISGLFVRAGSPSTGLRVPRLAAWTLSPGGRTMPRAVRACWGSLGLLGFGRWEQNPAAEPRAEPSCSPALPALERRHLLVRALPGAGQPSTVLGGGCGVLQREPARTIAAEHSFFHSPPSLWLPHMPEEQKPARGVTHPSGEGGIRATRGSKQRNGTRRGAARRCARAARSLFRLVALEVLAVRGL